MVFLLTYIWLLFFLSSMLFIFYYKHILLTLLSLEFMMISLTLVIYLVMNLFKMNLFFMTFYFSIMVCEAVLGLSVLVYLIRLTGNDYMNMLNILKW